MQPTMARQQTGIVCLYMYAYLHNQTHFCVRDRLCVFGRSMCTCLHNIGKATLEDGVHALCVCAATNVLCLLCAYLCNTLVNVSMLTQSWCSCLCMVAHFDM